jgi:LysR family transcriptional regulator, transcriptional activator of nhaA
MERLNHHHLYIFWTVANKGTFTQAANQLRIAQSAVTSQIKSLEESLGLILIDRSNRRKPVLTEAGKKVFVYADSIFESSSELLKWAKHGELSRQQTFRIGAISGLSRNLQYEFLEPVILKRGIKLEITTGDQEKLMRLLNEHSLDVVVSSRNAQYEGRSALRSAVLTSSPLIFAVKNEYSRKRESLEQCIESKKLYIPGQNFEARPELDAYLEKNNLSKYVAGEIDDIALLRIFSLRSGAVVAMPEMGVKSDIANKSIHVIGKVAKIEQRFYAITNQRSSPSKILQELVAEIRS